MPVRTSPHYQYTQITNQTANTRIESVKSLLKGYFNSYKNQLRNPETAYFTRSFKLQNCIPIFYGMPKVHKTLMSLCPVVSFINRFTSIFSNWLDYKMKELPLSFIH
jgi:hypothetical protein